jgi:hypothetical protein
MAELTEGAAKLFGEPLAFLVAADPETASAQQSMSSVCRPRSRLEVHWSGTWYPATVNGVPDREGRCLIGYDGYGANWDERVGPDRVRQWDPVPAGSVQ